jgi:hypothetical protein
MGTRAGSGSALAWITTGNESTQPLPIGYKKDNFVEKYMEFLLADYHANIHYFKGIETSEGFVKVWY